ncbi:MAG TPA: hypothetical protein VER83_04885, partial [Candidatus Nanopelagicales bacterium]|nr:hypothetical protein [Candidatus Nanopelagicales bacterium]
MHHDPDDLICPDCASYAHPFLEACPVCGRERASCFEAARAEPGQGFGAGMSNPAISQDISEVVLRYTLKASGSTETRDLHEGLTVVAGSLDYLVTIGGDAGAGSDRGYVEAREADLVVRARRASRELARIPLEAILAVSSRARGRPAGAWAGLVFEGRRERTSPPPLDGDLVVAHATPTGFGRLALANRAGLLSPRARPDHYAILARWLGLAAAAASERRWTAVGPARHAHELGLAAAPPDAGPVPAAEARAAGAAPAPGPASVVDAMRALEELRAAGLVSDG